MRVTHLPKLTAQKRASSTPAIIVAADWRALRPDPERTWVASDQMAAPTLSGHCRIATVDVAASRAFCT
jgi:hypothetical protein